MELEKSMGYSSCCLKCSEFINGKKKKISFCIESSSDLY